MLEVNLDKSQIALTMKSERSQERPERPSERPARAERPARPPKNAPPPAEKPPPSAKTPFNNAFAALDKLRRR